MPPFNEALEYLHRTLSEMQGRGLRLAASNAALAALGKAPVAPAVKPAEPLAPVSAAAPVVPKAARTAPAAPMIPKLPPLAPISRATVGVMFVSEPPGVGSEAAVELLGKIIVAMGMGPEEVHHGHLPPSGAGLHEEVARVRPKVLVALGAPAMAGLLGTAEPIADLRGRWHDFQGTPVMPTLHPSHLVEKDDQAEKRKLWEDMLLVLDRLGKPITKKQRGYFRAKE